MPILAGGEVVDRPELGLGDPADTGHLDSTVGLVWRALVVWLLLLLLIALAGAST
jgi:adenosylcobinamide-phosphate synthase